MSVRVFLLLFITLSIVVILTSPPLLGPFLQSTPIATPTHIPPTQTSTPTVTPDPFAKIPTVTPLNQDAIFSIHPLPIPTLGNLPPTVSPTVHPITDTIPSKILPAPTSAGYPPQRRDTSQKAAALAVPVSHARPVSGPEGFLTQQRSRQEIPERSNCSIRDFINPSPQCRWSMLWLLIKRRLPPQTMLHTQSHKQTSDSPLVSWPVQGRITQAFGCSPYYTGIRDLRCNAATPWFHDGLDIAAQPGTPVRAAMTGTVSFAGLDGKGPRCDKYKGYGLGVVVGNGQDWQALFAHLTTINVVVGQLVKPETIIGTVGDTGCVTGPHLHFGLRHNGTLVDPTKVVKE